MSYTTVEIPANRSIVLIDTRTIPKVVTLPSVIDNAGRTVYIKDYYGASLTNAITISTMNRDFIDETTFQFAISKNFGSVTLLSDGKSSWKIINSYNGSNS